MSSPPENLVIVNSNTSSGRDASAKSAKDAKKRVIKPLPSISAFKYRSILATCEPEARDVTDCLKHIASKYQHDLSCEVDEVKKAQVELIRRMGEIDSLLVNTSTQININIQQYRTSKNSLKSVETISSLCEQTYHRLDSIMNHLFAIEEKLPTYERLGVERSPHKQHYPALHEWMRSNDTGRPVSSSSPTSSADNSQDSTNQPYLSRDPNSSTDSFSSSQVPLSKLQERSLQTVTLREPSSSTDQPGLSKQSSREAVRPASSQSRESRESIRSLRDGRRALNTKTYPSLYPRPMMSLMSSTSHVSTTMSPIEPQTLFEEAVGTTRAPRRMMSMQSMASMQSLNSGHVPLMEADSASTVSRAATIKSSFSFRGIADFLKGSPKKKMSAEQRLRGFL
ncbi:hypothetical protein CJU90_6060 [Yarrowia sp. C11]|nr:hypothetical protein CJU90_6060 [Yarrowia sp. C11]KAG5370775.1 hypothetical protein CKK34_0901 [Yarrowia sp. E02]